LKAKHIYEFGSFRLDSEEKVLMRDGQAVPIPPKDLETLLVLVERSGHIVEKDELMEKVWPGVFIEEGNLSRRIFNLRQVLGEGPGGRQFIETVPKRGYRFVGSVREQGGAESPTSATPIADLSQAPAPNHVPRALWMWMVIAVPILATILLVRHFWPTRASSSQKVMLAVLPFENLSRDANEDSFSDGLTEEMIAQLGQVQPSRLGVMARTSTVRYKHTNEPIAQIGQELGVGYVLRSTEMPSAPTSTGCWNAKLSLPWRFPGS
jgi:DNA-binding winged helix-turn-helix (wHTH) protein